MKIAIIGAGNMGSAIVRGIMRPESPKYELTVSNPSKNSLENISAEFPTVKITTNNIEALRDADVGIFAVKPWILPSVAEEAVKAKAVPQIIVSIAAGVGLNQLNGLFNRDLNHERSLFYVIPNTAISIGKGMTFITSKYAIDAEKDLVKNIFDLMGETAFIEEDKIGAATALCSCGIAYAFKYIQACVQAGVQMGFRPENAQKYAIATVDGAMELLKTKETTPQKEIDCVTTPGGMTIRGINMLEHTGFTSSIIKSIIEPIKNE